VSRHLTDCTTNVQQLIERMLQEFGLKGDAIKAISASPRFERGFIEQILPQHVIDYCDAMKKIINSDDSMVDQIRNAQSAIDIYNAAIVISQEEPAPEPEETPKAEPSGDNVQPPPKKHRGRPASAETLAKRAAAAAAEQETPTPPVESEVAEEISQLGDETETATEGQPAPDTPIEPEVETEAGTEPESQSQEEIVIEDEPEPTAEAPAKTEGDGKIGMNQETEYKEGFINFEYEDKDEDVVNLFCTILSFGNLDPERMKEHAKPDTVELILNFRQVLDRIRNGE